MRVLIQRVTEASVKIDGETVGQCGKGFMLLVGFCWTDTEEQIKYMIEKCINLRIFEDDNGQLNKSLLDVGGELLVVSQFTLYADTRRGRRPGFTLAAPGPVAEPLYDKFVAGLRQYVSHVETGRFGADMKVSLINDGPVTILLKREPEVLQEGPSNG